MRTLVILGAAIAAFFVAEVSADKSITLGANNAFPPCVAVCADYPHRYLGPPPPAPAPTAAPTPLLPPNTCGQIGAHRYCARGDGSLILIW